MTTHAPRRRIPRFAALLAALSLVLLVAPVSAASAATPAAKACCGNKLVVFKEVVKVDGSSYSTEAVGQVRVSNGDLQNRNGDQIGNFTASHTIMSINDDGTRTVQNTAHLILPRGTIITQGLDTWPIGGEPPSGTNNTVAIVGGTGKYAGATGTAKQTLLANGYYRTVLTFKNGR